MKLTWNVLAVFLFCTPFTYAEILADAGIINQNVTLPNSALTPGVLCSRGDSDFKGYDYPERIARCNRNVSEQEKATVAIQYGNIPRSKWGNYEFDHLIPLCAGGSNDTKNLWPEPITDAKKKDVLEVDICTAMKAGTMTQAQAVNKVHAWFLQQMTSYDKIKNTINSFTCTQIDNTDGHFLTVDFQSSSTSQISDVVVSLVENGNKFKLESSEGASISGKQTRAPSGPLKDLTLFVIKQQSSDRFYMYTPKDFIQTQNFLGYLKISFEGSYPKLVSLNCTKY